jgi:hypothetical protein
LIRYWLTPVPDERFDEKIVEINWLYQQSLFLEQNGEAVISTDEMTGVQALERKYPGLPMAPGNVERREFEYIRHGTLSFIVSFSVASGRIAAVSCGSTRKEEDFAAHIQQTFEVLSFPNRCHFVADNLNIHKSESMVRYVAKESAYRLTWGSKENAVFCSL